MSPPNLADFSIEQFEQGEIEAGSFGHEAHVYLAWLYLDRYPAATAAARYTTALRDLTVKLGVPEKYHDTITRFFLLLIDKRRDDTGCWERFRAVNDDLFSRGQDILNRFYTRELLASDEARQQYLPPDKLVA